MIDLDNPELQNALQIIQFTRRSLFLTGKAGTGKSTFLRYIAANTKKKHIILAPTGIAAINAGGSTLHSFFKLPFHPLLPNDSMYSVRNIRNTLKYNSEKIKIIREVELIIIDEISMVRADIIDFLDKVLRVYCRNMREPFGGQAAASGGRYLPAGACGEGRRPSSAQSLLPQQFLLRCQGVRILQAREHRTQEGIPSERSRFHQHPRPYPHVSGAHAGSTAPQPACGSPAR